MNRIVIAIRMLIALVILTLGSDTFLPAQTRAGQGAERKPLSESWDICLLQGQRIGYSHTTMWREKEAGGETVRTEGATRLSFHRNGEATAIATTVTSRETLEGKLIEFESDTRVGPTPIRVLGRVDGDHLNIETFGPGAATPKKTAMKWSGDFRGPFGVEQGLLREPMRPGQRRTVKIVMPTLDNVEIVQVELTAKQFEQTALRGGPHELLRIENVTRMSGGQKLESTVWCDRTGDALKSLVGPTETYRATKAEALEKPDAAPVDLLSSMFVKPDRPLPGAHQMKRTRYRVRLDAGDPAAVFVSGASQAVKSIDPHTAEITVYAIRPGQGDGNPDAPADSPKDEDRQPNNFIQSDDRLIVADAQKAAGNEKDPWRVAVALERFVHREVTKKDFSQAFASAAEVAKSREGDCTEHAVFLAALLRARGIPARIAVGLVYIEGVGAFGYHMWTEAYIDRRWIPLDGTLSAGGVGAGHLKIAQSSLKGASAISAFLPVIQIIGRLKIEVP
ncbi:MAG: transglutaminase-like domain-containing protein [Thermoguttaceae bacterium]